MVSTTAEVGTPPPLSETGRWFRGDVDGLRAIAILLVVAYHAAIPGFGAGFIGVDVFFVISGFLISRNLLRETEKTRTVSLSRFWARRIRRLVPALALVIVVTLVIGHFVFPIFDMTDYAKQGASAALYVSNFKFAAQSQNYFAASVTTSPFLHTWSLGVEEQFYLVWPVVFALVCWTATLGLTRHSRRRFRRRVLIGAFALTFVVSLALNVHLTNQGSSWSFYGLPSRAWEFAVAGLLAAVTVPDALRGVAARTVTAVAGLALLLTAMVVIKSSTPYPGWWALLPVGATVLLITAGHTWGGEVRSTRIGDALSTRPMQWLGRVSYSWYLWHWPAIVVLVAARTSNTIAVKSFAALISLPIAWLAYRYYETPVRFARVLTRSSVNTFAFGVVVTAAVLAVTVVVAPDITTGAKAGAALSVSSFEAPSGSSLQQQVAVAVSLYRKRVTATCQSNNPSKTPAGDRYCVGGDPTATKSVMLLGDSHAGQWRPALEEIGRREHVKIYIRQHDGCPPFAIHMGKVNGGDAKTVTCDRQEAGDLRVIQFLKPQAVVVADYSGDPTNILGDAKQVISPPEQAAVWHAAVEARLTAIKAMGVKIGIILDEPTLPYNASDCIVQKKSTAKCDVPLVEATALSAPSVDAERQVAAKLGGLPTLDMTSIICDPTKCRTEIGGTLVYVDSHHLTDAFAFSQIPALTRLVDQVKA